MKPINDRVVVKPAAAEEKTSGGIIIPDTAKEKPVKGIVLAVGPGRKNDAGTLIPVNLKKDQIVMFAKWSGTEVKADGVEYLSESIIYAPGKAVNAGGVAVSGLEMSQNSMRINWPREEVDARLKGIMKDIHETCVQYGNNGTKIDYVKGANVGGFVKVAEAMLAQGIV